MPPLNGPENIIVLNPIAGKNMNAPVVHARRHADDHRAVGTTQPRRHVGIDSEFIRAASNCSTAISLAALRGSSTDMNSSACCMRRIVYELPWRPAH